MFEDIIAMRKHFGLPIAELPKMHELELMLFRQKLLEEETAESLHAISSNDIVELADSLVDTVVVAMGTAALCGFDWDLLWSEVYRSNMEKVRGDAQEAKRGHNFDLIKPVGWTAPQLKTILDNQQVGLNTKPIKAFYEAEKIQKQKGMDYNNAIKRSDYFPFGLKSYTQMLWMKVLRMKSIADSGKTPNFESMQDNLLDLINYASFMFDYLEEKQ